MSSDVASDVDFQQLATHLYAVRFLQEFMRWQTSQAATHDFSTPLIVRLLNQLEQWWEYYSSNSYDAKTELAVFARERLLCLVKQSSVEIDTASASDTDSLLQAWQSEIVASSKSARSRLNEVCSLIESVCKQ